MYLKKEEFLCNMATLHSIAKAVFSLLVSANECPISVDVTLINGGSSATTRLKQKTLKKVVYWVIIFPIT